MNVLLLWVVVRVGYLSIIEPRDSISYAASVLHIVFVIGGERDFLMSDRQKLRCRRTSFLRQTFLQLFAD